jgi:hypothetical protein
MGCNDADYGMEIGTVSACADIRAIFMQICDPAVMDFLAATEMEVPTPLS